MTLPSPNWNEMFTAEQRQRIQALRAEGGPQVANLIFREVLDGMTPPPNVDVLRKHDRVQMYDGYMAVLLSRKLAAEGL